MTKLLSKLVHFDASFELDRIFHIGHIPGTRAAHNFRRMAQLFAINARGQTI